MIEMPYGRSLTTPTINASAVQELISNSPLIANQTYTGAAKKKLSTALVNSVNIISYADQSGTIYLEESNNGIDWGVTKSVTAIASTLSELGITKITKRYYRTRFVNGSVGQTEFSLYETQFFNTETINSKITGSDVAIPVDVQYSAVKAPKVTLAAGINIDTANANRWPGSTGDPGSTDWSGWKSQVWRIDNSHAFDVTIFLNEPNYGDYMKADGVTRWQFVAKSGSRMLITPSDFPILGYTLSGTFGLGFTAASGGAGGITVISYPTPLI